MDVGARSSPLGSWWQRHGGQALALTSALGITVAVVVFREQLVALRGLGYAGVFLIVGLGNATVIFPVPSLAVVFAAGSVLNPLLVGLVAGVGEPLGELTGYLAGYGGRAAIRDGARFQRIKLWMERRGFLTLFVLSAIPNPVFDRAGIAAGVVRFPLGRFLLACWLGKTLKGVVVAYLGSLSVDLIEPWLR
ncbi:MAG TPA: VTT domain-containing protein [Anaerolineae bacterium]|nr:VTT domain-containing protein [Anaerolineae bacterium]